MPPRTTVVLVHGTRFSTEQPDDRETSDDHDDAGAWWQPDQTRAWLKGHLPPHASISDESFISFTWTGRNSQVSRLEAGNELLALLLMLERRGHTYHLIGHSHGGSVIQEALTSSEITLRERTVYAELRRALNKEKVLGGEEPIIRERHDEYAPFWYKYKTRHLPRPSEYAAVAPFIELPGLRSWTTVGTPFLHYLPSRRPLVNGWPGRRFSLQPPTSGRLLRSLLLELLLTSVYVLPFLLIAAMVISSLTGDWLRPVLDSAFTNTMTLPYVILWVGAFYAIGKRGYADTLLGRERAALRAFRRFGDRWLGLWSPSDEAIRSLAALTPKGPGYEWICSADGERCERPAMLDDGLLPLPKLAVPSPLVDTHLLPTVQRVAPLRITKPLVWMVNRWLEPLWRRKVARTLTRICQGSDLPAAVLAFVSPWPVPLAAATAHPGLPPDADARLERAVRERAGDLRPALRDMLMTAALEGVPEAVKAVRSEHQAVALGTLIHTSYFEDPDVGRLIALHMSSTATDDPNLPADDEVARWLAAHRNVVRAEFRRFFTTAGTMRN